MKVYVRGYDEIPEEKRQRPRYPFEPVDTVWVEYSDIAEWKTTLNDVTWRCKELNGMRVHLGSHYCEFSVEELTDGEFAIVCLHHPDKPL
jgi:hypothetical protein